MRKLVMWVLIGVAVAAVVWFLGRKPPVKVDLATIVRGPLRAFVQDEGRTRVKERYVVSAPVNGRLRRVSLEPGDPVEENRLVAEIDPLPLRSRVEEAEAKVRGFKQQLEGVATKKPKKAELDRARVVEKKARELVQIAERSLDEARAAHGIAEKEEQRSRTLARQGTIGVAEYDAARATEIQARERVRAQEVRLRVVELEVSIASLNRQLVESRVHDFDWEEKAALEQIAGVQAQLTAMRDALERTRIYAPTSGVVLERFKESEQVVTAGAPLMAVGDLGNLEVVADFLSEDVAHMKEGMAVEVLGRALGTRVVTGRVERIHPSAFRKVSSLGVEQQRVNVIASVAAGELGLGDQYRVEVRVILATRADALLVPEGALFRQGGAWHVYVVKDGTAQKQTVETGLRDGTQREVTSGLSEGDEVVLHPGRDMEGGVRVEPLADSQ